MCRSLRHHACRSGRRPAVPGGLRGRRRCGPGGPATAAGPGSAVRWRACRRGSATPSQGRGRSALWQPARRAATGQRSPVPGQVSRPARCRASHGGAPGGILRHEHSDLPSKRTERRQRGLRHEDGDLPSERTVRRQRRRAAVQRLIAVVRRHGDSRGQGRSHQHHGYPCDPRVNLRPSEDPMTPALGLPVGPKPDRVHRRRVCAVKCGGASGPDESLQRLLPAWVLGRRRTSPPGSADRRSRSPYETTRSCQLPADERPSESRDGEAGTIRQPAYWSRTDPSADRSSNRAGTCSLSLAADESAGQPPQLNHDRASELA
jgi:hypothetical protein